MPDRLSVGGETARHPRNIRRWYGVEPLLLRRAVTDRIAIRVVDGAAHWRLPLPVFWLRKQPERSRDWGDGFKRRLRCSDFGVDYVS
jgi:hypothetical protein